jgi:hypothetical protein
VERRLTWLGDVTFKRDDLPWDNAAEMRVPVDEDLQLVCQRQGLTLVHISGAYTRPMCWGALLVSVTTTAQDEQRCGPV